MASGIEEILTTLYEMVQDAWSLPLGADKCVLERDKVLDLLDEISNQLPGELKQAKTIVESRNDAPLEEKDYITMEDRQILIEDFRNHLVNTPALINNCIENGF